MRLPLAIAALVLAAPWAACAQESQGYAQLRAAYFAGVDGDALQLIEQVRPTFTTSLGERLKLAATVDLTLAQGRDRVEQYESASDYLEVSRLYLDAYSPLVDLRAGRQALHWGSAQFFNPTDPFPEVLLAEPWRQRRGVNAARAHLALSPLTDATAIVAVDDTLAETRAALRLRTNRWGADLALSGAWRGDADWLAGADLRGTLGVGFWVEAAVRPADGSVREEIAAGVDYSFPVFERLVVLAQYYRNGSGETSPDRYRRRASTAAADPFAPFTLARDYLLASVLAQLTAEVSASLPVLQNLNDGTAIALPSLTWAALDWLELALGAQIPFSSWGGGGEFKPRPDDLVVDRDLGPLGPVRADLSGHIPTAVVTFWSRASF